MMMMMVEMGCAPFTTDPFTTGHYHHYHHHHHHRHHRSWHIYSISWSGVIMMVMYKEVGRETDMVAD